MEITRVDILRDGGTIIIHTAENGQTGTYTLPSPLHREPRLITYNNQTLEIGSPIERHFLEQLKQWWKSHISPEILAALNQFDTSRDRHPLHHDFLDYLYIRYVISYLELRGPNEQEDPI